MLVEMRGIEKHFPGVHALKEARFDLYEGEVHALMGENGAGKSTLMKILSGVYIRDAGEVKVRGQATDFDGPRAAQSAGVGIIHQELSLMNDLTVAQNIFIGREPRLSFGRLDEGALNRNAVEIFNSMNLTMNPKSVVGKLTIAKQQIVEIAKALSYSSNILVMDEPTAALNDAEIAELFGIIRRLKAEGVGIIYISHKMDELKQIADRVTVMRDGETVDTVDAAETPVSDIISMMVGRTISDERVVIPNLKDAPTLLEVSHLNRGNEIRDVNFSLKAGEILGFAGLMGAGRTEVARAIFGADSRDSGEIKVLGKTKFSSGMQILDETKMAEESQRFIELLDIRTPSDRQDVGFLSGGNQQKVVIAKWLLRDCNILIFDEPTRGIDVGAKAEIYKLLVSLAEQGRGIIVISSELPEVLRLSHRIAVMCEGRLTGILPGGDTTQKEIMELATQRESMANEITSKSEAQHG